MLRQAALPWWQCASRILCHHANAARRSPQLSSTLARAFHHRGLPTVVLAHIRFRKPALAWALRAKAAHSQSAVTAAGKPVWPAALGSQQSGRSLAIAISGHLLRNALDLPHNRAVCLHLRRAPSQSRACPHRLSHSASYWQFRMHTQCSPIAASNLLASPAPFLAGLRYKPSMSNVSYSAALLHTVGAQGQCGGGWQHEPSRMGVSFPTAHRAHAPSTLRRRANPALKRNANSAARRPSSTGPYGPFCARCPTRHAVGIRLALR